MAALEPFGTQVTMLQPVVKYTEPTVRLSYQPDAPTFTIRTIIDAIAAVPSPDGGRFSATIYHPPSLEDRARRIQLQEQRALLYRLISAFIVAIPTFIIAVVYMSLVPKSNRTRMWFMEPMWAGNASRLDWAMFFLATPVMVYSAGMFHRQSLKELYALWRKGSRTPVWKRFVRFGSMNLLVRRLVILCELLASFNDCSVILGFSWSLCCIFLIGGLTSPCGQRPALSNWRRRRDDILRFSSILDNVSPGR